MTLVRAHLLHDSQWKQWDAFTVAQQQISETTLLERAVSKVFDWITGHPRLKNIRRFTIFCGLGNNGADGLYLAMKLLHAGCKVQVYVLSEQKSSFCFNHYRYILEATYPHAIQEWVSQSKVEITPGSLIIDSLLGTGINRPAEGTIAEIITFINQLKFPVLSIDLPSGLWENFDPTKHIAVQATYTITFEQPKIAHLKPEYGSFLGRIEVLPIGLDYRFFDTFEQKNVLAYLPTAEEAFQILQPRPSHVHKGHFGALMYFAGAKGSMGACTLGLRAAFATGIGRAYALVPFEERQIVQISCPEAQCVFDLTALPKPEKIKALCIGPGIGLHSSAEQVLEQIVTIYKTQPKVIDADAIRLVAKWPSYKKNKFVTGSAVIFTPHTDEFTALVGTARSWEVQNQQATTMAKEHRWHIVLKGAFTRIFTPEGTVYICQTGNPGMATGGSGDVLTGILGSLLAQGYTGTEAALLGVYLHGEAAKQYATTYAEYSLRAGNLVDYLGINWENTISRIP